MTITKEPEQNIADSSKIYLISPPQIDIKEFSKKLELALKTKLVLVFQLRLKNYPSFEIAKIAQNLKKICHDNNCLFLLNDSLQIALDIGADGVHLGVEDGSIAIARKKSPSNFVIGASCYDSKHLSLEAGEQGANYISFGAFFPSQTKISRGNPSPEILKWSSEMLNLPIVAIGGITDKNCNSLAKSGADFLAVISYVWNHPKGEVVALKNLDEALKKQNPELDLKS
jgi:thiamine-phosphate pyrophosphorylase